MRQRRNLGTAQVQSAVVLHHVIAGAPPDAIGLIIADRQHTFGGLLAGQRALAQLVSAAVSPGGCVAVVGENDAGWVHAYYGIPSCGRIATFVNHRLAPQAIGQAVRDSGAELVLAHPLVARTWDAPTVQFDRPPDNSAAPAIDAAHDSDAVAWRIPTSGTTGRAKVVQLSHRSVLAAVENTARARPFEGDEVYLFPFPLCHVAGYNVVLFHSRHRPVVLLPSFDPARLVAEVLAHGVTHVSLAPTMLAALLDHVDTTGEMLPTLRCISYGASPIAPALLRRAADRLQCGFVQGYGMTELSGNAVFLSADDHRRALTDQPHLLRAAGRPGPLADVRLAADSEILVSGDQVTPGYVDGADNHAAFVVNDGRRWLRTGDLGTFDDEGYLYVVDRIKDIIITGGENVSSRGVEDAMADHPDVVEVAAVGTPDQRWGETVTAVVTRAPGSHTSVADLLNWGRERIGGFAKPRRVVLMDSIPHNASGKVIKPALRHLLDTTHLPVPSTAATVIEIDGATLRLWQRHASGWRLAHAACCAVGRAGIAPLITRTEGDGTTPAGSFPLGVATDGTGRFSCFGWGDDPGVSVGWHSIADDDWWCCTPDHPSYDRLVHERTGPGDEHLASVGAAYEFAALIGTHAPGRASAIFLHVLVDDDMGIAPTAGCVAVHRNDLVDILRTLTADTWFLIQPSPG